MSDAKDIKDSAHTLDSLTKKEAGSKLSQNGLTISVVVLGAILAVFSMFLRADSFGLVRADGNTLMSGVGKFFQATAPSIWAIFLSVFLINPVLRLFRSKFRFDTRHLIIISIITAIPWGLSAHVMLGSLFPQNAVGWMQAVSGQHVATSHSPSIFLPFLENSSPFVHIQDWTVFEQFAVGGYPMSWAAWALPAITTSLFIIAMTWVAIVTAIVIRRRWSEHEHLRYPIGMVTMSMIEMKDSTVGAMGIETAQKSLIRSALFWVGIVFGAFEVSGVLRTIWPWWPIGERFLTTISHAWQHNVWLPTEFLRVFGHGANAKIEWLGVMWFVDVRTLFSVVLWSRVVLPIFHAICYPMNWFSVQSGVYHAPTLVRTLWGEMFRDTVYLMSQPVFLFTGLSALWLMRNYLKQVVITAFSPKSKNALDDSDEPISYKMALITGGLAFAYMVIYGTWYQMNVFWSIVTMFMYFIIPFLVSSRMRSEFGMPGMDGPSWNITDGFWRRLIGKKNLGDNAIGMAAFTRFGWASHCVWPGIMLEGFSMMDKTTPLDSGEKKNLRKSVVYAALIAVVVALVVVVFVFLPIINTVGIARQPRTIQYQSTEWFVYESAANHSSWRPGQFDFSWNFVYIVLISAFFVFGATWGMSRFVWWPLNPYGLSMIVSSPTNVQTPALWAWALKSLAMRYGGIKLVHKLNPLMLGAVVGAALMQLFGVVVALIIV